jgi:superoxide reductase
MTENNQVYICEICNNVIKVLHAGVGELVCCGKPMNLIKAHTIEEEGNEKHVPVIEKTPTGVKVKVGSVPHPMEEKHFIGGIGIFVEGEKSQWKVLKPGDPPEVEFEEKGKVLFAESNCNIHGLWKSESN